MKIRISPDDCRRFAAASHDVSPLHVSEAYARRTAYAEPVVHGVLGLLAALAHVEPPEGSVLARVSAEFVSPLYPEVDYAVRVDPYGGSEFKVRVTNGLQPVLRFKASFASPSREAGAAEPAEAVSIRSEARPRTLDEIVPGQSASSVYAAGAEEVKTLLEHLHLDPQWIARADACALLALSYVVGMEMPGGRALFGGFDARLSREVRVEPRLRWDLEVTAVDPRFSRVDFDLRFQAAGAPLASARVNAFVLEDVPDPDAFRLAARLPPSRWMEGRRALITGASRGLGLHLARALVSQGATVFGSYSSSGEDADRAQRVLAAPARFFLLRGDSADPSFCAWAVDHIRAEAGPLDLLVCNAAPPLRPLSLQSDDMSRRHSYLLHALALVESPIAACLPDLVAQKGQLVLVSSSTVESPLLPWPQYTMAKCAAEGFVRVVSGSYPALRTLIVRPARFLTGRSNTPVGRMDAAPPEPVAAQIVEALRDWPDGQPLLVRGAFPDEG